MTSQHPAGDGWRPAGDVLLLSGECRGACIVEFCAAAGPRQFIFLRWCLEPVKETQSSWRWRLDDRVDALELSDCVEVRPALFWRRVPPNLLVACCA